MGILKVAITIFILVLIPYLLFALPARVRKGRSARIRYSIFLVVVALFILWVVRIFH